MLKSHLGGQLQITIGRRRTRRAPAFSSDTRFAGLSYFPRYFARPSVHMPKVFLKTYGCQMNERDSEQVSRDLVSRGYEMTADEKVADVVLLNTCSVRDMAEQKALGKMGMLARLRTGRPEMIYGFLGCMAQSRGEELVRGLGHVDLV